MWRASPRKHNRLKGYDYSKSGAYFVTICTKGHAQLFGEIAPRLSATNVGAAFCRPELSPIGKLVESEI